MLCNQRNNNNNNKNNKNNNKNNNNNNNNSNNFIKNEYLFQSKSIFSNLLNRF